MFIDPRVIILFCGECAPALSLPVGKLQFGSTITVFIAAGADASAAALYLNHRSFFLCTLLTGLWVDAALPATFGLFTCGFLVVGTLIAMARIRFRAEHNYHPILLAHIANFACLVLLTFSQGLHTLSSPASGCS